MLPDEVEIHGSPTWHRTDRVAGANKHAAEHRGKWMVGGRIRSAVFKATEVQAL
jgi:hypothetical protein